MDASAAQRAARLRRIAAIEIARHREEHGFLGAALDGSLATGAVWPTSDLDFTVVPDPKASCRPEADGERRESIALELAPGADTSRWRGVEWGQRDGIVWHKHLPGRQLLLDLVGGYPDSFIRTAEGEFDLDANWFLDGFAAMELIEDPQGLLAETKSFVAARRFAPEVWEGRRTALLAELRRQRNAAHEALDRGEPEAAYRQLSSPRGLAAVAAQLWLEAAHRIYSSKEQDGLLAEVTQAAGFSEAHALYRAVIAVKPERAEAAAPLLLTLGREGANFCRAMALLPSEVTQRYQPLKVWEAWIRHLSATLSLAPRRGHPAYAYQQLDKIAYWTVGSPQRAVEELREKSIPGLAALDIRAANAARLADSVRTTLFGETPAAERARGGLAAARKLLDLTERAC